MTPQEFKAWFDGFTEAFDKVPTKAQWARIQARVAEIDGRAVTERVYVDRYWPSVPYNHPWWHYQPSWVVPMTSTTGGASQSGSLAQFSQGGSQAQAAVANAQQNWNSGSAMYLLGRADAGTLEN